MKDPLGIFSHYAGAIDPEVAKAQKMQELKDLAEWRARHLQQIKEWSDPVKRAERQAKTQAELQAAIEMVAGTTVELPPRRKLEDFVRVKELKQEPKGIIEKITEWFK